MTSTEAFWRRKTDYEVEAAAHRLDEYTDDAKRIILAELERRRDTIPDRSPLYELVAQELALGKTTADVEKELVGQGVHPVTASSVIDEVRSAIAEAQLEGARAQIQRGSLIVAIGVAITFATYMLASMVRGSYVIAWGAILYGLYEIWTGWTASRGG